MKTSAIFIFLFCLLTLTTGVEKLKLWYIEKNNAIMNRWSDRFGYYQVGDGFRNGAPYYISEDNKYSIWKDDNGKWCNGLAILLYADKFNCAMFSGSKDLCSSDWNYSDENHEWQPAFNGIDIQCQGGGGRLQDLCTTISGPDPGKSCVFPFKFRRITYYSCTTSGNKPGNTKAWCSTKLDNSGVHVSSEGNWGDCDPRCQSNPLGSCPYNYPNAYLNGGFCCATTKERYNTPNNERLDGTCDGKDFNRQSVCCENDSGGGYIRCPKGNCYPNGCPSSHPFTYLNGDYCCKTGRERYPTPQSQINDGTCDGSDIGFESVCCDGEKYIRCPSGSGCTNY